MLVKDFFWEMNNLSSTNKRKEIGIFRFFYSFFENMKNWSNKRTNKIRNSANPWPISTSIKKKNEVKPFHE